MLTVAHLADDQDEHELAEADVTGAVLVKQLVDDGDFLEELVVAFVFALLDEKVLLYRGTCGRV